MDDFQKKHLQDILTAIEEIDSFIHGYDSLSVDILWSMVINHLPKLRNEVISLLNS